MVAIFLASFDIYLTLKNFSNQSRNKEKPL